MVIKGIWVNENSIADGIFINGESQSTLVLKNTKVFVEFIPNEFDKRICFTVKFQGQLLKLETDSVNGKLVSSFNNIQGVVSSSTHLSISLDIDNNYLEINRSLVGTIPLYHLHVKGHFVAFSTHMVGLLDMAEVKKYIQVNPEWIATYLSLDATQLGYTERTPYLHIKRLLPGYSFSIQNNFFIPPQLNSTFSTNKWVSHHSTQDFGNAFKELLKKSVKESIGAERIFVSQLSGGLDSSSISSIARIVAPEAALHTVFIDIPVMKISERKYAEELAKSIHSIHHTIEPSSNDFDILRLHTALTGLPEIMISGPSVMAGLLEKARDTGATIMLGGHDGDSVVGIGIEYPQLLYKNYKWRELLETLKIAAHTYPHFRLNSNWNSLSFKEKEDIFMTDFLYSRIKTDISTIPKASLPVHIGKLISFFGIYIMSGVFRRLANSGLDKLTKRSFLPKNLLSNDLESFLNLPYSLERLPLIISKSLANFDMISIEDVYGGETLSVCEHLYALKNHYHIIEEFPFFNQELFELGMSVPLSVKYDNGALRGYMREGLRGILPESIRTRGDKSRFGLYSRDVAIRLYNDSQHLLKADQEIWNYVDYTKFQSVSKILLNVNSLNNSIAMVLNTIFLAVWLDWFSHFKTSKSAELLSS